MAGLRLEGELLEWGYLLFIALACGVVVWQLLQSEGSPPRSEWPRLRFVWWIAPCPFLGVLSDRDCAHVPGGVLHVQEILPGRVIGRLDRRPVHDIVTLRVAAAHPMADRATTLRAPAGVLRFRFSGMRPADSDMSSGPTMLLDRHDLRIAYVLDGPIALDPAVTPQRLR